jgi:hypothetical protein
VFVINLNDIDIHPLYADDNGVWNVATPRKYFRVEIKDGKIAEVLPSHKDNYTHLLKRQYGKHQATYSERGINAVVVGIQGMDINIIQINDKHGILSDANRFFSTYVSFINFSKAQFEDFFCT